SIRGVDSTSGGRPSITAGSQPRTPILVDGIALPSNEASAISEVSTWDVSTVEVARGPQPTSTGRNAIGGAIRVFTNDPVFRDEAAARVGYFNQDDTINGAFLINTELIEDQLAFRLTGEGSIGETFIDIIPTVPAGFDPEDEDFARVRGKLLYEPADMPGLSLLLSVDHTEREQPIDGFVDDPVNISITNANPFALVSSYEDVSQTVYQAKSTYEVNENFTLVTRIASLENDLVFRDTDDTLFFPFLGPFDLGETGFTKDQIEGEIFLQFEDIGLIRRGVLGVIHNTEDEEGFNNGTLAFDIEGRIQNTGVFGEVEISADQYLEGLTLIAGARLEFDDRERTFDSSGFGNTVRVGDFEASESEILPKFGIRYDAPNETSYGYTYTRGFRAGGLDTDPLGPLFGAPLTADIFDPEFIDQHEIYARGSFMEGRLDLSATAFFYQWDDAQVVGASIVSPELIGNVPEAEGFGAEFNLNYVLTPEFAVRGALGLLHTEITDAGPQLTAFEGSELPRAPEVTASAGFTWSPFDNFSARADVRHVSETITGLGQPTLGSYTVVDLGLSHTFTAGEGEFELEIFAKNLFDERFETFAETSAIGILTASGRPQTFGVSLTGKW
ncbi:MAG: TonB-dependent receptor, partial [Pseudomonadota bacterium]